MIHLSVVCCGRAIPLRWKVLEHGSATLHLRKYRPLLRRALWLLRTPDVMLLDDQGLAKHDLIRWLQASQWR
jgi:hypothetical protein